MRGLELEQLNSLSMWEDEVVTAVNWNHPTSELANDFWMQQWKQIWHPEEIEVSKDIKDWRDFEHKDTYKKVLAGLTLLDTIQTNVGMNKIVEFLDDNQEKAVCTAFGAFEAIHARSYSYIFMTLLTNTEIDELYDWIDNNKNLQYKAKRIGSIYAAIQKDDKVSLWQAMFASVMLESFLFYSGFFYPLYLGGKGTLRSASEVISLILRDESIHGVAIGFFAQTIFREFDKATQDMLKDWAYDLLIDLYQNEVEYTKDIYAETGLAPEVIDFIEYNANKALANIGLDPMFDSKQINATVMTGIRNSGSVHDFFSQKGTNYVSIDVTPITDEMFIFDDMELDPYQNLEKDVELELYYD